MGDPRTGVSGKDDPSGVNRPSGKFCRVRGGETCHRGGLSVLYQSYNGRVETFVSCIDDLRREGNGGPSRSIGV